MDKPLVGFAMCGSFCTFSKVIPQMYKLKEAGFEVQPIMSFVAYDTDTRFGAASELRAKIENICEREIWHSLTQVEPIGPKRMLDLLIIEPATGNTIAKLANGIADTPVTLAAKAHLRNCRPILVGISTNDALSCNAVNIGKLMNTKNYFFLPFCQDDSMQKPASVVADFSRTFEYASAALSGIQLQPLLL